jgi:hypothetical protein
MFRNPLRRKEERRGYSYLAEITRITKDPVRLSDIEATVENQGFWQDSYEWRISTVMETRIEAIEKDSRQWFRVTVKCDHEFRCHTQTIERAVYFSALYQQLIIDMFYNLGWASSSLDIIKDRNFITW